MEWTRTKLREEIEDNLKPLFLRFTNIDTKLISLDKSLAELKKLMEEKKGCDN